MAAAVSRSLRYQKGIDREHFHVDGFRIHALEALFDDDEMLLRPLGLRQDRLRLLAHEIDGLMEMTVRVDIDGLDALAVDHDRQRARGRGLRLGCAQQPAATEHDPAGGVRA